MTPSRRRALAALAALAAAGCATRPAVRADFAPAPDAAFTLAGRLSARQGDQGVAAGFRWTHAPGRDELVLATPMGTALARLEGSAAGVRVDLGNGRVEEAPDWESLTARALGAPLPVRGLAWWVRASPHPGSAYAAEADAAGRLAVLRQDGWSVVYAYRDAARLPLRLVLAYPDVEVRLVVDDWVAA